MPQAPSMFLGATPTDPDVRDERIRFLGSQSVGMPLAHHCAALHGRQMLWTLLGVGRPDVASSFWNFPPSIGLLLLRRRSQYRHACSA
jgi:hypothetical protein